MQTRVYSYVYIYPDDFPHCAGIASLPNASVATLYYYEQVIKQRTSNTLQRVYSYIYSNHYTCIAYNEQFSAATPYYDTHDSLLQLTNIRTCSLTTIRLSITNRWKSSTIRINIYCITQTLLSIARASHRFTSTSPPKRKTTDNSLPAHHITVTR